MRLYRRLNEHNQGNGACFTSEIDFDELVGLYKVPINACFMDYHLSIQEYNDYNPLLIPDYQTTYDDKMYSLNIENWITELLMYKYNYQHIRGGKYCKDTMFEKSLSTLIPTSPTKRPFCNCGLPAEVKITTDGRFYFVCSLKNVWEDFFDDIIIPEPCDFYEMYNSDTEAKIYRILANKYVNDTFIANIPDYQHQPCVGCRRTLYLPIYSPRWGTTKQVCTECLANKRDELESQFIECMLID